MKRLFLLFLMLGSPLLAAEFHVSPGGNDSNDGSESAPFASFNRARDAVRAARKTKPDEATAILFHEGKHYLPQSLALGKDDSGTTEAPLTIAARKGDRPVLIGGKRIDAWAPCQDAGFPKGTWQADLSAYGIKDRFKILYSEGRTMTWARYPNFEPEFPYSGGWAYVDGEPFNMYQEVEGERLDTIRFKPKDLRNWSRPQDGFVSIFPRHNWWNVVRQIKEIDRDTATVTVANNMSYAARPADRFCVFGMREELDAPGEWYQDVEKQILYFFPADGRKPEDVVVPTAGSVVALDRISNVRIAGLTLYGAGNHGLSMNECSDCTVEACTVHDVSFDNGSGIHVWKGRRCTVAGCDVYRVGAQGISMTGGDLFTLTECGHVVENNYVHHTGEVNKHGVGINANGCGIRVANNLVHDMPRYGIMFGGANIVVEYNHVRHVNLEMEDSGLIYTNGSHWMNSRGSTIRYNRFQDSIGFGHKLGEYRFYMFTWGIYLDDNTGGVDVYGNIVERCTIGGFHLHNSRDNLLYNNIFVDGGDRQFQLSGWTNDPKGRFMKRHRDDMIKAYEKAMLHPGWHDRRGMNVHPRDAALPDGTVMANNRIERNIFYYPNQPASKYVQTNKCNFTVNSIDGNIIWNGGKEPIRTGFSGIKEVAAVLTERIPGVDFKDISETGLPKGWTWYQKTLPDAKVESPDMSEERRVLRLHAAYNPEAKYIRHANVRSPSFELEQGKTYRLRMKVSLGGDAADDRALVRFVTERSGYWKSFGNKEFRPKTGETVDVETIFHVPAVGETDYDERNVGFSLHFQHVGKNGWSQFENVVLEEVVPASEWEAWQMQGCDRHSMVADPLFVDAAKGDFRLKADSPALKKGFEQIPFEKIGPRADSRRASWPIVEAEGIRENPQWLRLPNTRPQAE